MKRSFTVGLAMVAGAALGAAAVEGLHAQAKPPVYQIVEIDVLNQDAYVNDYAPKAQAAIKAAGGKFLAAGGKTTTIEGDPRRTGSSSSSGTASRRSQLTAHRRLSRIFCHFAKSWRNSAASPSKGYPNNLTGRCNKGRLQGGLLSIRLSGMAVCIMPSARQEEVRKCWLKGCLRRTGLVR